MKEAILAHIDAAIHYPDPRARELRASLAAHYDRAPGDFILGNGAAELFYLYTFVTRPKRVLLPVPAFSEYERAAHAAGAAVSYSPLEERAGFEPDLIFLAEEAQRVQPDVILMTGMNSGTTKIDINLAALNIKDALIEDNMGRKPWNEPILADAPAAYFATIPVHEIVRSLRAQKLPVQLEFASGGYVCNEIFYRAAHAYAGTTTKVGFVHVSLLPEMVFDESLARPLEETSTILKAIIECL